MYNIGQNNAANSYKPVYYNLGEKQSKTRNYEQRKCNIHGENICQFLKWIEFPFECNRKWMFFSFEYPPGIILKLLDQVYKEVLPLNSVIPAIAGKNISGHKEDIINSKKNSGNIMPFHCTCKSDYQDIILFIGILHADPGDNQYQEKDCIKKMP